MDIDALKTFLEVTATKHFGTSAKSLFVSQSTVSARIKLLEERLGVPLFSRQRNNIHLTSAGERLVPLAETIVTAWNRAKLEIAVNESNQVPFVVGALPSLWDSILKDWITFMRDSQPTVILDIEAQDLDMLVRRVKDGTVDIAYTWDQPQIANIRSEEVSTVPLILVSTKPDLTVQEALSTGYVLVEWGTSFAISHAQYFPDAPPPEMRVEVGRIALDYIFSRGGSGYFAEPMVEEYIQSGELYLVDKAPKINRNVYSLYQAENDKQEIINHAQTYFNT